MRRKGMRKVLLSLLLSAVMIVEPATTTMVAYAVESDANQQSENSGEETESGSNENGGTGTESGSNENGGTGTESGSNENGGTGTESGSSESGESETGGGSGESGENGSGDGNGESGESETGGGNGESGENGTEDESGENEGDGSEVEGEEGTKTEEADETEAEETLEEDEELEEEETEELEEEKTEEEKNLDGFSAMPSDYVLSSEQKALKADLAASMSNFDRSAEGSAYVESEVIVFADTREEAEMIAAAYHAEIISYDMGIAVLKLGTDATVEKAVRVASDMENNLPAVFPNYYRYAFVEETSVEEIPAETEIIVDNSGLEIVEEEIEVDSEEESYDNVAAAYENTYLNPGSSYYQWQHVTVGSTYAWNEGYTGSGVKVAVLDTGVSGNSDITVAGSYNYSSSSGTDDAVGHGTHVAGIIGAKKIGTDGIGIAPDATIYNVRVLDANGSGTDAQIMQGIRKAIELDVDLINMSLGGIGYNPIFQTVVDEAYNAGIAVFVAAGNDGGNNMNYPAAYNHIICVGATDNNNQRASFSNYGAWVDISAPGVNIWSTVPGNTYGAKSGTSMACPVATGEAAVILSSNPVALAGKTGAAKVDALEKLMKSNVVSAGSGMGKGITILTKVFKLSTAATKPVAPVLKATVSADSQNVTVTIDAANDTIIYYTTNGKNPTYKNGVKSADSFVYSGPLTLDGSKKITVSAIAVNDSGVCSAVKKITCTLQPYVQSITISGVSQIALGKTSQLKATVLPSYASNTKVTWSINAPADSGVKISTSGKVTVAKTATYNKTYTVTATAQDGSGKIGTFPITVIDTAKIKSVKFTSTKLTLTRPTDASYNMASLLDAKYVDDTAAKVTDFNWTSSNVKVATVSSKGVVTPLAPGNVTITAAANDTGNKRATCTITIKQQATGLTITGNGVSGSATLAAGKKITLKANVEPANANNKKVTWSIDAPEGSGVTINQSGVVSVSSKAAAKNYYTVTATTADGSNKTATYKIIVKSGIIKTVTLDKKSATIFRKAGSFGAPTYTTVTATLNGSEGFDASAYTVKSSNEGIATIDSVSADGNVITIKVKATGKATGKTAVTVTSTDGSNKKATFNVTVNNPVSRINIAPTAGNSAYVAQGKSLQLKATLETEYGAVSNKNVTWSINASKESGVKISTGGKVTATKTATAGTSYTVTATAKDGSGVYATYTVRISSPVTSLYLYDTDYWGYMDTRYTWPVKQIPAPTTEGDSGRGAYLFNVGWSGNLYGGVTVSSSNPSVSSATVVSSGGYLYVYVSADKPGNATITIKANDGSGKQVKYKFKVVK